MDITLKKENYKILQTVKDNSIEECVEADFSLPEYMPEILRIIKSSAEIKINSCRLVGERVTIDGVCELRMIYTGEDGCIYSFSQSKPFTRHCENSGFSEGIDANCKVNVSYVNCRATGTKRAEIKAGLLIRFFVHCEKTEDVISLGDECPIEKKTVPVKVMSLGCKKTRSFSMSDTISLNTPSAFVISSNAVALCTQIRKINNKIMVKGDAVVNICYVNATDKSCTEHIKHKIPVNQILDFEGMEERFSGDVSLCVMALDVIPKGETSGVATAFEISLGIDACVTMWEEKELVVISDAYAVGKNLDLKKNTYSFSTALDEIQDRFVFENDFSVSGEGVGNIVDSFAEITSVDTKNENGEFVIFGSISLSLIIKDRAGSLSSISKIFDYTYKKNVDYEVKTLDCTPDLTLTSLDCLVKGDNNIGVRFEIQVCARVFANELIEGISHIAESEMPLKLNRNAITVYFPQTECESLWSIARRYNTTVKAIALENELEGDTTESLKMIFIPSA